MVLFTHTERVDRRYADVEYFGRVYLDAELMEDEWHFEDPLGGVFPFTVQHQVHPINAPQLVRRHPPSYSGHCQSLTKLDGNDR